MSLLLAACLLVGQAAAIPTGPAKIEVALDGYTLDVFTYKPASYQGGRMLMVFHGVDRNAEEYRDDARGMADRFGMLVVAPRFDAKQFGRGQYQQGGLFKKGQLAERAKWTFSLIPKLVDELRRLEQAPDLPWSMIGHSAGGQFLGRMGAFMTAGADRVVIANAGSYIFPTRDMDYPYGFGGLPEDLCDDDDLRLYLARPLTLYLGTADTERDVDLDKSPAPTARAPTATSAARTPSAPRRSSPATRAGSSTGNSSRRQGSATTIAPCSTRRPARPRCSGRKVMSDE